jgi:glycosyltransferase involved in cell wall biosynthesis
MSWFVGQLNVMVSAEEKSSVSPVALQRSDKGSANDRPLAMAGESAKGLLSVSLLTGGGDRPYALGMASALIDQKISTDFIGSDDLNVPELHTTSFVTFLNLRGDQRSDASFGKKAVRVLSYYWRLLRYAASAQPPIFHILWNNKFELFDRTLLMLYYKFLGKRVLLTAHNVSIGERDANDSLLKRISLRIQYRLSDHVFVHTEKMKGELALRFGVSERKITVVPFGINNTVPNTTLSTAEAKRQLGIDKQEKTLLFFGNIAPYKGLDYLVDAFSRVLKEDGAYRLIIAGRPKGDEQYWQQIKQEITRDAIRERIIQKIEYVPDEQTELYFKAADVLILPYTHIFQSGVLFLSYAFGLPVIAADTGSLRNEVIEGETGFLCRAADSDDLAKAIKTYFASDLYRHLDTRRDQIRAFANERNSWTKIGEILNRVYQQVLFAK